MKTFFVLILQCLRNCNLYINVEEIKVFQHRNNVILSSLKQHQNLMLKQRWFWVDTKTNFALFYQQTKHVESMSKFRWHLNIDDFPSHFDMLFWCNFDTEIIDAILMYIFDIILKHVSQSGLSLSLSWVFLESNFVLLWYETLQSEVAWTEENAGKSEFTIFAAWLITLHKVLWCQNAAKNPYK